MSLLHLSVNFEIFEIIKNKTYKNIEGQVYLAKIFAFIFLKIFLRILMKFNKRKRAKLLVFPKNHSKAHHTQFSCFFSFLWPTFFLITFSKLFQRYIIQLNEPKRAKLIHFQKNYSMTYHTRFSIFFNILWKKIPNYFFKIILTDYYPV